MRRLVKALEKRHEKRKLRWKLKKLDSSLTICEKSLLIILITLLYDDDNNNYFRVELTQNKFYDDSWKQISNDDAWIAKYYQQHTYSFEEAIKCHVETHHQTMYNVPNAPIFAYIQINMQGEKQTRFVDNFHRMAPIEYKFDHGEERSILVFTKGLENIEEAKKAGATLAGDASLVKSIQNGDLVLNDYQYIIAHTNMLPDLVHVRGLMRKKFPNPKNGTMGSNVVEMVNRFMNGITYSVVKDENQKDFAALEIQIGTLDMEKKHLESNLSSLLKDIDSMRPKREGKFITRVTLKSPPSKEELKIDPFVYVTETRAGFKKQTIVDEQEEQIDEDGDVLEKKEAVN